jgi:hypothetical protein
VTDYKATPEQWAQVQKCADAVGSCDCSAILELRARIETLEAAAHKHIVETSANILALVSRIESLEAAERTASKVYEISEPLKLTPEQAQQVRDLLAPEPRRNYPAKPENSLVERVVMDIGRDGETARWNEARAAIREVAAWLREQHDGDLVAATVLEREAEQ